MSVEVISGYKSIVGGVTKPAEKTMEATDTRKERTRYENLAISLRSVLRFEAMQDSEDPKSPNIDARRVTDNRGVVKISIKADQDTTATWFQTEATDESFTRKRYRLAISPDGQVKATVKTLSKRINNIPVKDSPYSIRIPLPRVGPVVGVKLGEQATIIDHDAVERATQFERGVRSFEPTEVFLNAFKNDMLHSRPVKELSYPPPAQHERLPENVVPISREAA